MVTCRLNDRGDSIVPSRPPSLFDDQPSSASILSRVMVDAVALARDRAARLEVGSDRCLDVRLEVLKCDQIVADLVRVCILGRDDVRRLATTVSGGYDLSVDGLAALREVVVGWMMARASPFATSGHAVDWRVMTSRLPIAAAFVVEAAVREAATSVMVVQVRSLAVVPKRGVVVLGSSDFLVGRSARRREVEDPDGVTREAEQLIREARESVRRIKRRKADAAKPAKVVPAARPSRASKPSRMGRVAWIGVTQAMIPAVLAFRQRGRSLGVPDPACGSGHGRRRQPRLPDAHPCVSAARRRSPA